ncbi:MAG: protein-disulfide reductase DsbD family protein [Desulfovibrio sp.]
MKNNFSYILIFICALLFWPKLAIAEDNISHNIQIFQTDERSYLAVVTLTPQDGWYTYAHSPGTGAMPTILSAKVNGTPTLSPLYPIGIAEPNPFSPGEKLFVYKSNTNIFIPLPANEIFPFEISGSIELLACKATACLPLTLPLQKTFSAAKYPKAEDQDWWRNFQNLKQQSQSDTQPATITSETFFNNLSPVYAQPSLEISGLVKALFLGLIAGFILNFMPCVLPVVSLKFSALLSSNKETNQLERIGKFREHNTFFVLGVLTYFGFLAAILGATGSAWGAIFQSPTVVQALCVAVFLFGLSLFGVFNLPIIDLKADQKTAHPRLQPYFTGVLATLLATPCSGPFLGGVLGWALLQPPFIISTVFLAVGVGMSLPYIILSAFPALVKYFPRPGAWTIHLERLAGLLLFGTAVYLMSILPDSQILTTMILLWFFGAAAWLWGFSGPHLPLKKRVLFGFAAICICFGGVWFTNPDTEKEPTWIPFTYEVLAQTVHSQPILVDFTADWCPSCKVLEQAVFTASNVQKWKKNYNMAFIQVDLTESNPVKESFLKALGSRSIPVIAIFTPDQPDNPIVLRDIFTTDQLERVLRSNLTNK